MDSTSLNQYEEQLYSVFKTFDINNEEALTRSAVLALCDALQLEERGAALVDTLFDSRAQRVTFAQFRGGLLAVLGADSAETGPAAQPAPAPPAPAPPTHSDEDSSGREVAPKFVFGSKKYGRRSRPPRALSAPDDGPSSPRALSAPDDGERARRRMRCKRSASVMETRGAARCSAPATTDLDHDSVVDAERALALCRRLHMDGIDRELVESIFKAAPQAETTVGEFFDRLNASLTTSIAATNDAGVETAVFSGGVVDELPCELVVEQWEGAGVQRARRLLAELGFEGATMRVADLECALDDELRALEAPPDARALLLQAALALSRLLARRVRHSADAATAERDRLRADVAESNRRARILAQEVDESHARLEAELTASLRRAEMRHAEAARAAEAERMEERERAAAERTQLESELARRTDAEARLRGDASTLRHRVYELETRAGVAEERAGAAERERARLAAELREVATRAQPAAEGSETSGELTTRLEQLRLENKMLRDRCDELCAALERGGAQGGAARGEGGASWREEAGVMDPRAEECDSAPTSLDNKVVQQLEEACSASEGDSSMPLSVGVSAGVRCASCGAPAPARVECGVQAEEDLATHEDDEKQKLNELIKELELSLEQMKVEYERCEEYWSGKLREERAALADEQRLADQRLADLVTKIQEYERQFLPGLPPIPEEYSLETQFAELEREFCAYRRAAQGELDARAADAAELRRRVRELEAAPAPSPTPPAPNPAPHHGVSEVGGRCAWCGAGAGAAGAAAARGESAALRGRLARAEAAVSRLSSRLAAADLLVKDLYVENCLLGPLPRRL